MWTSESLRQILEHGAEQRPLLCADCRHYHLDAYKALFEQIYKNTYATPEFLRWEDDDTVCIVGFMNEIRLNFDEHFRYVGPAFTEEQLMGGFIVVEYFR